MCVHIWYPIGGPCTSKNKHSRTVQAEAIIICEIQLVDKKLNGGVLDGVLLGSCWGFTSDAME